MADLIYREKLMEQFHNHYAVRNPEQHAIMDEVCMMLIKAPTVDAVEVVRCKECIRRYDTDECPMCFVIRGKYYEFTRDYGFCYRGERKVGDGNG